jgi:hypothetical protein
MIPASLLRGIHLQALVHAAHHARLRPATGGPDGAGFDVHWRRRAARIANASRSGPPPYRNSGPAPHDSWSRRQASPQQLLTSSMASGTTASRGRAPAIMPRSGSRAPAPWLGCVVRAVDQVVGARSNMGRAQRSGGWPWPARLPGQTSARYAPLLDDRARRACAALRGHSARRGGRSSADLPKHRCVARDVDRRGADRRNGCVRRRVGGNDAPSPWDPQSRYRSPRRQAGMTRSGPTVPTIPGRQPSSPAGSRRPHCSARRRPKLLRRPRRQRRAPPRRPADRDRDRRSGSRPRSAAAPAPWRRGRAR